MQMTKTEFFSSDPRTACGSFIVLCIALLVSCQESYLSQGPKTNRDLESGNKSTNDALLHGDDIADALFANPNADGTVSPASDAALEFDTHATLKSYAKSTKICSHTSFGGASGILSGPNTEKNQKVIDDHLNCIQPAVYPAWGGLWPANKPDNIADIDFDTTSLDALVNWGTSRGLTVIHHMLVGPNLYYPSWFKTTDYAPDELDALLKKFITSIMNANNNKDKVYSWNLINEIFNDDTGTYKTAGDGDGHCKWTAMGMEEDASGLTGSDKINTHHPIFVRKTFEYAAQLAKGKLEIRDYNVEFSTVPTSQNGTTVNVPNKKALALFQLVKHLKNKGVKIDAVGLQCHFNHKTDNWHQPYDFSDFKKTIAKFKSAGVEVYVTELDVGLRWDECVDSNGVRIPKDDVDWTAFGKEQPQTYNGVVKAAREAGVALISTWGMTDGTMETWRKDQRAWVLDENYDRKEAYQSYLKALYDTVQ